MAQFRVLDSEEPNVLRLQVNASHYVELRLELSGPPATRRDRIKRDPLVVSDRPPELSHVLALSRDLREVLASLRRAKRRIDEPGLVDLCRASILQYCRRILSQLYQFLEREVRGRQRIPVRKLRDVGWFEVFCEVGNPRKAMIRTPRLPAATTTTRASFSVALPVGGVLQIVLFYPSSAYFSTHVKRLSNGQQSQSFIVPPSL